MTTRTADFERWLAAEQDVKDATQLLRWSISSPAMLYQSEQALVVTLLRQEASALLQKYLNRVEAEALLLDCRTTRLPLRPVLPCHGPEPVNPVPGGIGPGNEVADHQRGLLCPRVPLRRARPGGW